MIHKRLSDVSCNEEEYEKAKPLYETAWNESGYETTMTYAKTATAKQQKQNCNIIWFNPPYSQNVKT